MSEYGFAEVVENVSPDIGGADAHYIHPTDETKMWCGATRRPGPIREPSAQRERVTCVVCADLRAMYGIDGWLALRNTP